MNMCFLLFLFVIVMMSTIGHVHQQTNRKQIDLSGFHLEASAIIAIAITIARIKSTSERLIQMGERTHHHDQLITLPSLSPMNRIVRAPVKLIPPEDEEDEDIVLERDCLIAFCSMRSRSLLILFCKDNEQA